MTHLHPKEETLGTGFKLQHIDTTCCALTDSLELAVIRKNDQVLRDINAI